MHKLFREAITGTIFVEDLDVVTTKLAVLNTVMMKTGELDMDIFYKLLGIRPQFESVVFSILKGTMFFYTPIEIDGVPIVEISINRIDY